MTTQREYWEEIDDTQYNTDNTYWTERISLSFTPPEAGKFLIEWYAEITTGSSAAEVDFRAQLDNVNMGEMTYEPEGSNEWTNADGWMIQDLSAAPHSVDLDWRVDDDEEYARIRRARIYVRRLS